MITFTTVTKADVLNLLFFTDFHESSSLLFYKDFVYLDMSWNPFL